MPKVSGKGRTITSGICVNDLAELWNAMCLLLLTIVEGAIDKDQSKFYALAVVNGGKNDIKYLIDLDGTVQGKNHSL